ncbi:putative reverse transcriptase [Purpureocillium lavendulum]|uniref:Reverse transcriptase n=1 Tax=Purpureocillium lavendulum TaxID=1247861 RepID=A0AB34FJ80_9HYPO|nr:putative reverse transcriptase [Purpureocillium lavendulum]
MAILEEAITVARQAVDLTPADHPDRAIWLLNLGNKLKSRYESTGELANLEEAITVARQAVGCTPADHPNRAAFLNNLGNKIESRYERTGKSRDLEEASSCFHAAWSCQTGIPFHRANAAARCLALLAKQSRIDAAIQLGQAVLDLLPAVNTKLLDRSDKQFVMSTFAGVAANVCACLLAIDQSARALESLERGRAVIISELVDGRDDLSALRHDYHDIACRYERLRDEINDTSRDREEGSTRRAEVANQRRETLAELNRCVLEIRGLAGYERFLLGQTVAEMQECALEGTIVVVNITDFRSDAILLSKRGIWTLNLPRMLALDAKTWLSKKWTGGEVRRSERARKNKEYLEHLVWLWDVCVKPVLDALDTDHTQDALPRIWWIGTGLGSSMPFHAAGMHSPGSTENALSKAVSSHTPSIKILGYAHRRARITKTSEVSLLIATMPTTPANASHPVAGKLCDLPAVVTEEQRVRDLLGENIPVQLLKSPSVADVMDQMRHCSVAHFACHGLTDHTDPSNSGLILQKQHGQAVTQDRLTVRQVSELSLSDARIAYLSACSTAENNAARLADEVIHVVSGFQVAGFPHVVGCLWPSIDRVCVEVACGFYQSLLGRRSFDGQAVACALREAVMAVREEDMSAPLVWAQFVHFGA